MGVDLRTRKPKLIALLWLVVGLSNAFGQPEPITLKGHEQGVVCVAFDRTGERLAPAGFDKTVILWDVKKHKIEKEFKGHNDTVYSVDFSPDGSVLVSASKDQTVKVWDLAKGQQRVTLGHPDKVHRVMFSPDGKILAAAHGGGSDAPKPGVKTKPGDVKVKPGDIKLWDTDTWKEQATLKGHTDWVSSLAFSPDGLTLASTSGDLTARLWDVRTRTERAKFEYKVENGLGGLYTVSFSPNGKMIAAGTLRYVINQVAEPAIQRFGDVQLWDIATGQEQVTLKGHKGAVTSVRFSPDGTTLASASEDKTIKLWDTGMYKERASLDQHSDGVFSIAFSPDGHKLASASNDRTVIIWSLKK